MSAIQPLPLSQVFDIELLLQPVLFSSCAESQNYTDAQPPTPVATTTHKYFLTALLWLSADTQRQKPTDLLNAPLFKVTVLSISWEMKNSHASKTNYLQCMHGINKSRELAGMLWRHSSRKIGLQLALILITEYLYLLVSPLINCFLYKCRLCAIQHCKSIVFAIKNQHICIFKKLEPVDFLHFCFQSDFKD